MVGVPCSYYYLKRHSLWGSVIIENLAPAAVPVAVPIPCSWNTQSPLRAGTRTTAALQGRVLGLGIYYLVLRKT